MHQSFDSLPPLIIVAFESLTWIIITLFHINIITHLNHSVSSVLQATRYCELIRRVTMPCLKKKMQCGNGGIQSKGSVFLFLWNLSPGNNSTFCLCNSVKYICTVTDILEGWRI